MGDEWKTCIGILYIRLWSHLLNDGGMTFKEGHGKFSLVGSDFLWRGSHLMWQAASTWMGAHSSHQDNLLDITLWIVYWSLPNERCWGSKWKITPTNICLYTSSFPSQIFPMPFFSHPNFSPTFFVRGTCHWRFQSRNCEASCADQHGHPMASL